MAECALEFREIKNQVDEESFMEETSFEDHD
jgi:hypothetical protein